VDIQAKIWTFVSSDQRREAMPGVFISHSSADKELAFKLAADLLNAGFPVWLDAYEIGIGSPLRKSIHAGIDTSTHLILLVSSASIASNWVQEELELALEKEKELSYPFVLPVRLDDCIVPLAIWGRLNASFSNGYLPAFEQLEAELRRRGAHLIELPFEKQLIPLRVEHSLFVDEVALSRRIKQLKSKPGEPGNAFLPTQIVLSPDPTYDSLRAKLIRTLEADERIQTTPRANIRFLRQMYEEVKQLEQRLPLAVADALNHIDRRGATLIDPAVVTHWIVRIFKNELLNILWGTQKKDTELIPISDQVRHGLWASETETATFYGIEKMFNYTIFQIDTGEIASVRTAFDHRISKDIEDYKSLSYSIPLIEAEIPTIEKYVLPQIFYRGSFREGWTIEKCRVRYP
jgi:hypothetical protein